jgi:spoIIIJ-associated protein
MKHVEAEGDTIDDAIARALDQLGVSRDRVEVEILSNVSKGLFGLGGRKARVRATLRAPMLFDAEEGDALESGDVAGDEPGDDDEDSEDSQAPEADFSMPRRDGGAVEPAAKPVERATLERAQSVLQELLRLVGSDAKVGVEEDADGTRLVMTGDESGILIGRRGQTLDALEYVLNRIVTREEDEVTHLVVDSQNYRTRRRQSLVDLARRLGERARRRGKAVTLNPMSPRDRRVVHLALQDDASLTTRSSGRGYYRKLLIIPSGDSRRGRPRRSESSRSRRDES